MKEKKIVIIGAGVAGLIAAIELEKKGYAPTLIEATDRVGGRIKTDRENEYLYDHGFQVILTAYPEVSRYLDIEKLDLRAFRPGARIYDSNKSFLITDPIRNILSVFSTAFSPVGTWRDKWKIWQLTRHLKQTSISEIFDQPSTPTIQYLKAFGFSQQMIHTFFQPFFGGIFLDQKLETSSRMFAFIFKMFSEGHAAIPAKGMQQIPDQLLSRLDKTTLIYNTSVKSIQNNTVSTAAGEYPFDYAIVATNPDMLIQENKSIVKRHRSTINLYYSIPKRKSEAYIGLLPTRGQLINNFCVLSDVAPTYAPADRSLVSVSIIGHSDTLDHEITHRLSKELQEIMKLEERDITFLRSYRIPHALPIVETPSMKLSRDQIVAGNKTYLAGDYLSGGSLNGAMASGRQCVEILLSDIAKEMD